MAYPEKTRHQPSERRSLEDGALDTLGCVFSTLASDSFTLDTDRNAQSFPEHCLEVVRHIENGHAAPLLEIEQSDDGARSWNRVRRFYIDRRRQEKTFVTTRFQGYRDIVEDLVGGLRDICAQGSNTELLVTGKLVAIESAVERGELAEIKRVVTETISEVNQVFMQNKNEYEQHIQFLHERMAILREDLVAVQKEMKLDALTNIYNRGAFDASIDRCLKMHFVFDQDVSLILIDVDNFKEINDTYGHSTGDKVLQSIASCLVRSFIRKNDLIARYGGDEFAVILPDTSIAKAQVSIDRFLASLGKIEIEDLPDTVNITCSAGVTEVAGDDNVESLVARADKALYAAKQAGRNCFRFDNRSGANSGA